MNKDSYLKLLLGGEAAVVISFLGLAATIWQAHKEQEKARKEDSQKREKEKNDRARQQAQSEQRISLIAQEVKFQSGQITLIFEILSQFTFNKNG
ncbi:hypothetical protein [Microcoleus sp. bin38.metabat.b11b12b14.051]|uniref:hypothetical protein n=1 Tax=Microcoleus sp. bin38.metabat.b11b12b14.051 TaxID=2742709 RepID=UPI0026014D36|nr:hypothetical protein [Microcoleus sp. bin38.metabat.b11b12b14.051]